MTAIALPVMSRQIALSKRPGVGMDRLGPRTLRGIVFHRALSGNGGAQGVADWLKRADVQGLTDLVIDHRTGQFIRINEITGTSSDMAGWANGPYQAGVASADAKAFVAKFGKTYGASVINTDLESIEVSGDYDTPISEACKAGLAQWTAARATELGCTAESFPVSPKTGLTILYGHREFCGVGYKQCPGSVVWDFVNGELVTRVKALLADGATEPPAYSVADIPDFLRDSTAPTVEAGGTTWRLVTDQYRTIRATPRLKYGYATAPRIGPDIPAGTDFNAAYIGRSATDKQDYLLSPYGTRIRAADAVRISDLPLKG